MATVKNISALALELPSGRLLLPGDSATNVNTGDVTGLLEDGLLAEVKTTRKRAEGGSSAAQPDSKES